MPSGRLNCVLQPKILSRHLQQSVRYWTSLRLIWKVSQRGLINAAFSFVDRKSQSRLYDFDIVSFFFTSS
jgi:hypothetical protein